MIWSWTWDGVRGVAVGVGDAVGVADADGAAGVAGDADVAGDAEAATDGDPLGLAAVDAAGVGDGVGTIGWPLTSDACEVRMMTLATTADTKPTIRPTR